MNAESDCESADGGRSEPAVRAVLSEEDAGEHLPDAAPPENTSPELLKFQYYWVLSRL
jgi:hypothetical protein